MAHLLIENYQKLSLHKIGQSAGFLGRLLRLLLKTGLPFRKNVLKPLENVLKYH